MARRCRRRRIEARNRNPSNSLGSGGVTTTNKAAHVSVHENSRLSKQCVCACMGGVLPISHDSPQKTRICTTTQNNTPNDKRRRAIHINRKTVLEESRNICMEISITRFCPNSALSNCPIYVLWPCLNTHNGPPYYLEAPQRHYLRSSLHHQASCGIQRNAAHR